MKINLIPDVVLNRRREAQLKKMTNLALFGWMAALAAIVVIMLGALAFQKLSLKSAQSKQQEINDRVNSKENKEFRKEALAVQASLTALKDLFNNQRRFSVALESLSSVTPKTVQVKDFTLTDADAVTISAQATSYVEAGKMIVAMKESEKKFSKEGKPYFQAVAMGGATQHDEGVNFTITATYLDTKAGATP